jgi:hypothetical protein
MLGFLKRGVCEWFQKKKLDQNNQPTPKYNNSSTQEITPKNPDYSIIQWNINGLGAHFENLVEEVERGKILE